MAINLELYANGNDPFTFRLDDYIVHVHAGAPPTPPTPVPDPPPVRSRLSFYDLTKTPIELPIGLAYVYGADEVRDWLNEVDLEPGDQPCRFRLDTVSGSSRLEVQTLLEGLRGLGRRGVDVEIVGWSESEGG